jgi:NhaA family Na+:H+ antiporter
MGSIFLLLGALAAVIVANSQLEYWYHHLWETEFGFVVGDAVLIKTLHHWVNDGLMAIFFFLVGLEIKRELLAGELASFNRALLPAVAAIGGMVFPALVYATINLGGEGSAGWGIPMATDIAFAAGCIALLKKWVPTSLMVFLVALAIVDDLGAVTVIAIFYTDSIEFPPLIIGTSLIIVSFCIGRLGVRSTLPYAVFGMVIWVAFLSSGVHATIAGVLLAFTIPSDARYKPRLFRGRIVELLDRFSQADENLSQYAEEGEVGVDKRNLVTQRQQTLIRAMNTECLHVEAPLQRFEHNIEPFCAFIVMPIFAFANAGVHLDLGNLGHLVLQPVTLGISLGLLLGKPVGIVLACFLAVRLGWASLPNGVRWTQIFGVSLLAAIGFTMSLFINELAFVGVDPELAEEFVSAGKVGIFVASIIAACAGLIVLKITCRKTQGG